MSSHRWPRRASAQRESPRHIAAGSTDGWGAVAVTCGGGAVAATCGGVRLEQVPSRFGGLGDQRRFVEPDLTGRVPGGLSKALRAVEAEQNLELRWPVCRPPRCAQLQAHLHPSRHLSARLPLPSLDGRVGDRGLTAAVVSSGNIFERSEAGADLPVGPSRRTPATPIATLDPSGGILSRRRSAALRAGAEGHKTSKWQGSAPFGLRARSTSAVGLSSCDRSRKRARRAATAATSSAMARCSPMHALGPPAKGMWV
jgi:hypothetical protein